MDRIAFYETPLAKAIENEVNTTHTRVANGELPANLAALSPSECLALLVEEIGEIAELVKVAEGRKPKKRRELELMIEEGESVRHYIACRMQEELKQTAAIAVDWHLAISEAGSL